jgi:hypothetical protein
MSSEVMTAWVMLTQVDVLEGWTAAQTAVLAAALIAVLGVTATILTTSERARREHLTDLYAQALGGVADYLEGPYRIRRKDGTAAHRNAISAALSDVKSSIDHSQELLRLHARRGVANAYDDYVVAAKIEAGQQMHEAWELPAIASDAEVNLHIAYDRTLSNRYRAHVVRVMQTDLARRIWNPWPLARYTWLVNNRLGTPERPTPPTSAHAENRPPRSVTGDSVAPPTVGEPPDRM